MSFSNCHFIALEPRNQEPRVFRVESGGVSFVGCDFMDTGREHIYLAKDVGTAVVMGNRFRGKMKITNESEGNVQIGLNVDDARASALWTTVDGIECPAQFGFPVTCGRTAVWLNADCRTKQSCKISC